MPQRYSAQTIAASPNTEQGLDFDSSMQRLKSANQQAFKQVSKTILDQLGLKNHKIHDAIGDWVDGAENSVVHTIDDPVDYDTAKYASAWIGMLANQKAVLHFSEDDKGPDSMYEVHVPDTDPHNVRKALDAAQIPFRTLIPSKHGTTVMVFDSGRSQRDNIANFAGLYNAVIRESAGRGEFVGDNSDSPTRAAARRTYRSIIADYESGRSRSPASPTESAGPSATTTGGVSPAPTGPTQDLPDLGSPAAPTSPEPAAGPAQPSRQRAA